MMHTEGDFIEAKNYTVQLAHFFSHLGNFRRPVDPALCLAFDFFFWSDSSNVKTSFMSQFFLLVCLVVERGNETLETVTL